MRIDTKPTKLALAILSIFSSNAFAQQPTLNTLDNVEVKSSSILLSEPENLPGSYNVLSREELDNRSPFSIIEAVQQIPGLSVVAEDAAGTHLNIGVRGLNPRRSSRTLLLEDGAPTVFFAPYGDPSSHYSTPLDRVERIEVLKGSGQILYGPQTLGGMINFVTRSVPKNGLEGSVKLGVGSNSLFDTHAYVGSGSERGGFALDIIERKGDGIRTEHGFKLHDIALKGQFNFNANQTLKAKLARFEEDSLFSETGLTAQEYRANRTSVPGSEGERFVMSRDTAQLIHEWKMSQVAKLSTQVYYTKTFRESKRTREFEPDDAQSGLGVRANESAIRPRRYEVFGFEPKLELRHNTFGLRHEAIAGFRYHDEKIDRQKFLIDGLNGPITEADERLKVNVKAIAYYVQNTIIAGNWTLTPGVRVEDVEFEKTLFGADDANMVAFSNTGQRLLNKKKETLPGLGFTWNGLSSTTFFGGVHKGFAPPRPDRDIGDAGLQRVNPELATITELGIRTTAVRGGNLEATLFNMNIDDLVVQVGGVFRNEGRAQHSGLELGGRLNWGELLGGPKNPYYVGFAYTNLFTAKFKDSGTVGGEGEDGYGSYTAGNRLPYTPKHTLNVNLSYENPNGLKARVGATHLSQQFANTENLRGTSAEGFCPGGDQPADDLLCGLYGEIDSYTLLNASASFTPSGQKITYFVSAENLTDKAYFASRTNGLQPGRGRLVFAGIRVGF